MVGARFSVGLAIEPKYPTGRRRPFASVLLMIAGYYHAIIVNPTSPTLNRRK